jgi:malate dehydrogenase
VSFIAVVGGGPLGGGIAQKLALRDRVPEIRLIDPHAAVAQGKALDILQSSPVERFSARIVSAQSLHAAAGAGAIVIADAAETGREHTTDGALQLVRALAALETAAPLVFAGASQRELIGRSVGELKIDRRRALGTAPFALESALRALAGLALDRSGAEVQLSVVGSPPERAAVAWEEATASGMPLRSQLPPHAIASLAARIPTLWPPGPLSLASAAARVVEGIVNGSRRRFSCFVALDAGPIRQAVVAMPVEVGTGGLARILEPALTGLERTQMENAIERQGS